MNKIFCALFTQHRKAHTFWHTRVIFKHGPNCVFTPCFFHYRLYTYWYWSRFHNVLFRQDCFSFWTTCYEKIDCIRYCFDHIYMYKIFSLSLWRFYCYTHSTLLRFVWQPVNALKSSMRRRLPCFTQSTVRFGSHVYWAKNALSF